MPFDIPEQMTVRQAVGGAVRVLDKARSGSPEAPVAAQVAQVYATLALALAIEDAFDTDVADAIRTLATEVGGVSLAIGANG
jgi:hypothetical protein